MADETYRTVKGAGSCMLEINKSKFIGNCYPLARESEAQEHLSALKKQYWDARHHCYAYSLGKKGELARFSDDGEPGGTAGLPMMEALRGAGVTDVLVVVTRYFGGVLLGTGGLVRAYSKACAQAIAAAGPVEMVPCDLIDYTVPYEQWARFEQELMRRGAKVEAEYREAVYCRLAVDSRGSQRLRDALFDLSRGTLTGKVVGREYRPEDIREK